MRLDEYASNDAIALAGLVASGEVTPRELALTALAAIEAVNPALNAVIETYQDRIGELDESTLGSGPFRGVPFLMKDAGLQEAGRLYEMGSRLLAGRKAPNDTNFMKMIKASGLNPLGRTNVPEFCIAGTTEGVFHGNASNPWRQGFSAGGSSGGSQAAVSAGIVPMAHGSDIGGSIRIPASYCGGVGLKPSRGRISYGPDIGEGAWGMVTSLVQTRTVRDAALALDCLSIPQPGDPFVIRQPDQPFLDIAVRGGAQKLRIGYSCEALMPDQPVNPDTAKAVHSVAATLQSMGHSVEEAAPAYDFDLVIEAFTIAWFVGYSEMFESYAVDMGRSLCSSTLEPMTLAVVESAKKTPHIKLFDALDYFNQVRREFGRFFTQYDVWLTPATAQPSEPWGKYGQYLEGMTGEEYIRLTERPVQFAIPYNVTGFPAISLPLAETHDALPIGIQLGSAHSEEAKLLRLAADLEKALPWAGRIPPIHVSNA